MISPRLLQQVLVVAAIHVAVFLCLPSEALANGGPAAHVFGSIDLIEQSQSSGQVFLGAQGTFRYDTYLPSKSHSATYVRLIFNQSPERSVTVGLASTTPSSKAKKRFGSDFVPYHYNTGELFFRIVGFTGQPPRTVRYSSWFSITDGPFATVATVGIRVRLAHACRLVYGCSSVTPTTLIELVPYAGTNEEATEWFYMPWVRASEWGNGFPVEVNSGFGSVSPSIHDSVDITVLDNRYFKHVPGQSPLQCGQSPCATPMPNATPMPMIILASGDGYEWTYQGHEEEEPGHFYIRTSNGPVPPPQIPFVKEYNVCMGTVEGTPCQVSFPEACPKTIDGAKINNTDEATTKTARKQFDGRWYFCGVATYTSFLRSKFIKPSDALDGGRFTVYEILKRPGKKTEGICNGCPCGRGRWKICGENISTYSIPSHQWVDPLPAPLDKPQWNPPVAPDHISGQLDVIPDVDEMGKHQMRKWGTDHTTYTHHYYIELGQPWTVLPSKQIGHEGEDAVWIVLPRGTKYQTQVWVSYEDIPFTDCTSDYGNCPTQYPPGTSSPPPWYNYTTCVGCQ